MSADPAPGAPGKQQQPGKAGEAAGQKANAEDQEQNGGNGVAEEVTNILNADPPSWPWIVAAFGILAVGTIVSYVVWRLVKPGDFMPSSNYAVYAGLFVMALALERVLEPFSGLFIPSMKAKKAKSTAMAAHAKRAEVVAATSQLHAAVADPAAAAQRTEGPCRQRLLPRKMQRWPRRSIIIRKPTERS
jgi:hypothetical protein